MLKLRVLHLPRKTMVPTTHLTTTVQTNNKSLKTINYFKKTMEYTTIHLHPPENGGIATGGASTAVVKAVVGVTANESTKSINGTAVGRGIVTGIGTEIEKNGIKSPRNVTGKSMIQMTNRPRKSLC